MSSLPTTTRVKRPTIIRLDEPNEIVLGGGAGRGIAHCGFLRAIEEARIQIGTVTGVSIGSLVAAFYTNGYSYSAIREIFLELLSQMKPIKLTEMLVVPKWLEGILGTSDGIVNLNTIIVSLIEKYKLRPQKNLRIIAYDLWKQKPIIFEGTDYDLATALSASCAIPLLMRPVWYGQGELEQSGEQAQARRKREILLVDGGVHHPNPGQFCSGPAIISKLGTARSMPEKKLSGMEWAVQMFEVVTAPFLSRYFPDPQGHLVIDIGVPDIASLNFALVMENADRMIEYAYNVTKQSLAEHLQD